MKKMQYFAAVAVAVTAVAASTQVSWATQSNDGSIIVDWNQLAQKQIAGPPFSQVRQYAMLHIAMADAVIAIEGRYEPFFARMRAPRGASAKAAAAQAAHDVLAYLAPTKLAAFDAELAGDLAGIPAGPKALGVQVGKKTAAWVIAWRTNDGAAASNPNPSLIEASELAGIWRPTFSGVAAYSNWGSAEPFALQSPTQFLPLTFPQLESERYATDFNEVKNGRRPSTLPATRDQYTDKQRTALLWAGGNASGTLRTLPGVPTPFANVTDPLRIWQNVAGQVGKSEHYSLVKMARLFALVTVSIHDSLQTAHASKFIYRLWRPETAIAEADLDDNADTVADTSWVPLLITPPYPSHASNMTCIGAGAARMLANVFGTDTKRYTAAWYQDNSSAPAVVFSETLTSFKALAVEEGNSRVWGGIHFRFELDASHDACTKAADYIFEHKMQSDPFPFHY
jgi:hypothetical protein